MASTLILSLVAILLISGCSQSSDDGHQASPENTVRAAQVFSAKTPEGTSMSGKIAGDMLLSENGDLHYAQILAGQLTWVKSETFKVSATPVKGDRGSKIFVGSLATESLQDKIMNDLLVDSSTADIYSFNGTSFVSTGLNIKGQKGDAGLNGVNGADGSKGDKGDKGDAGVVGQSGANGTNGSSCSVSKSGTVATISCTNGTSATVSDGANGTNGSNTPGAVGTSVLNKGYIVLKASHNYNNGGQNNVDLAVDATRTIVLPESLQVTYGNAGSYTAKICVGGVCCVYKGGADIQTPLNPGWSNNSNAPVTRADQIQIEKGRQYRFQSCDSGNRTIVVQQYQHIYMGIDYGDPSMATEITATIEVK